MAHFYTQGRASPSGLSCSGSRFISTLGSAGREKGSGLGLWALYSFSSPILFYAVHLYPEVPDRLFSVYVFRKVTRPGTPLELPMVFLGFLLGPVPWFGLKYNFIFWPLFFVSLYFLHQGAQGRAQDIFYLPSFPSSPWLSSMSSFMPSMGHSRPSPFTKGSCRRKGRKRSNRPSSAFPSGRGWTLSWIIFSTSGTGCCSYSPLYFFALLGLIETLPSAKKGFLVPCFYRPSVSPELCLLHPPPGRLSPGPCSTPVSWIGVIAVRLFLVHSRQKSFRVFFRRGRRRRAFSSRRPARPSFFPLPANNPRIHLASGGASSSSQQPAFFPAALSCLPSSRWTTPAICPIMSGWLESSLFSSLPFLHGRGPLGRAVPSASCLCRSDRRICPLGAFSPQPALSCQDRSNIRPKGARILPFSDRKRGDGQRERRLLSSLEKPTGSFGSRKELERVKLLFGSNRGEYDVEMRQFDLPLCRGKTARRGQRDSLRAGRGLYIQEDLPLRDRPPSQPPLRRIDALGALSFPGHSLARLKRG